MNKLVANTTLFAVLCLIFLVVRPSQALSCGQVSGAVAPCISYLTQGGSPTQQCCNGVKSLRDLIPTQPDRQTACNCLKAAASSYPSIKPDAASNLPGRCGVPINIPISTSTNCNRF
ncbi:hypothetical protein ACH5RR_014310 [Cinchona calisaya]|uniref:Non-specific lipid-transfer protein n=1 Tax=Cinchona calisaya TaxID=153742 RepID=A0ABD3A407_9GENT